MSQSQRNVRRISVPRAKANVSLDAATIKIEQLQMELAHRNTNNAILPFFPKLLKATWANGCPNSDVTIAMTSGPIQNAIVIMTAQPVIAAVINELNIANGTALAAFDASSAIVADDSKPDTTHTGVRKHIINAQPSLFQKPVFWKSANTKLALFFSSEGVPAASAMINARSMANWMNMYVMFSLWRVLEFTQVMPKVRSVVAANMP